MNRNIWHAENYVPLLMMYGFTLHIIRVATYLRDGTANLSQIILPLVDLPLALMMAYCALAMIFARRQFFKVFEIRSTWRKVIHWMITVYIAGSVPGHSFLLFGNTAYFDFFPWWFGVILLFAYAAIIAYFFSLKPSRSTEKV